LLGAIVRTTATRREVQGAMRTYASRRSGGNYSLT
jgi:hypothetical protein